jgi:hypothetical protein
MTRSKFWLFLLTISLLVIGFARSRPDREIAFYFVHEARNFPADDIRVSASTEYLIWLDDVTFHDELTSFVLNCYTIESPLDKNTYDYRAASAAKILGLSSHEGAYVTIVSFLKGDFVIDGPINCLSYMLDGLAQRPGGIDEIIAIAGGETKYQSIQNAATRYLENLK